MRLIYVIGCVELLLIESVGGLVSWMFTDVVLYYYVNLHSLSIDENRFYCTYIVVKLKTVIGRSGKYLMDAS